MVGWNKCTILFNYNYNTVSHGTGAVQYGTVSLMSRRYMFDLNADRLNKYNQALSNIYMVWYFLFNPPAFNLKIHCRAIKGTELFYYRYRYLTITEFEFNTWNNILILFYLILFYTILFDTITFILFYFCLIYFYLIQFYLNTILSNSTIRYSTVPSIKQLI